MADIGPNQVWLVPETNEVKKKWLQVQIQEKKSRIVRLDQDIEDLVKGQIVKLEGHKIMLQKELNNLTQQLDRMIVLEADAVIINQEGGQNG
jgi:uncharacterized protein YPO0396